MHKLVVTHTHGVTITNGTQIHCIALFYESHKADGFVASFLYNERGVLIDVNRDDFTCNAIIRKAETERSQVRDNAKVG